MTLAAAAAMLGRLSGWKRNLVAMVLGAATVLALPPAHLVFLLVPAFAGLVLMAERASGAKAAFAVGWCFGLGYFALGLYWVSFALLTEPEKFGWMIPFAVLGLGGGLAIFPALATCLFRLAIGRVGFSPAGRVVLFATLWVGFEWVRSWIFTGFPWNLIGTAWTFSDAMIQSAAAVGVYGLSLLTIGVAAMPAVLVAEDVGAKSWRPVVGAFALLAAVWVGGAIRLQGAAEADVEGVRLRLVQPNIAQTTKWKQELRFQHVLKQLAMSARPPSDGTPPPTHIVWAETAVPFYLSTEPRLLAMLGAVTPPGGAMVVGAPRATPTNAPEFQVWNSVHTVLPGGRIGATYDKFHLVPFGEYVPFKRWLDFAKITHGRSDFSSGPGIRTISVPGAPAVSPLVCYEAIFPGHVVDPTNRPGWMLNVTNDAWFGRSAGPYQHFAATRLRAVEEGLPLVRVANTGISAIVDGYGRVRARLGLGQEGVIDGPLPAALAPTLFARWGNLATLLLLLSSTSLAYLLRRR